MVMGRSLAAMPGGRPPRLFWILAPQYQQVTSPRARTAVPSISQKSTEKPETEDRVLVMVCRISSSWTATSCSVWIDCFNRLTWLSVCWARCISSEGNIKGLKDQGNTTGSALTGMLWSDRSVWLNNCKVQPGLKWSLAIVLILIG